MAREDRRRVLKLLGDGKISAEEADRLLEILDSGSGEERGSETVDRGESRVSSFGPKRSKTRSRARLLLPSGMP